MLVLGICNFLSFNFSVQQEKNHRLPEPVGIHA